MAKKKSARKKAKKATPKRKSAERSSKFSVPRERLTGEDGEVVKLYGRERCVMPGDEMQQRFGDNCKILRIEQGYTVQAFADKIEIHRTTVHRLEAKPFAHRTSVATAVRIARALGESVENMCMLDYSNRIS